MMLNNINLPPKQKLHGNSQVVKDLTIPMFIDNIRITIAKK